VLTAHITTSVGWFGVVTGALALTVTAMVSPDQELVRSVYRVMDGMGWYAMLPFSLLSLASGLLQSLTGKWGLLRHYWVVVKLVMNLAAVAVLLLYMQTLDRAAAIAAHTPFTAADLHDLRDPSPMAHSVAALLLLLTAVALSVYKPPGLTRYGQRKRRQQIRPAPVPAVTEPA
jgi:hypothetical protein